ncbi:MAG: amidohydrolase family protein [Acidobacteria bacterium]|nr:amidohydrolase family protein [Acidobacteriota bacterium]
MPGLLWRGAAARHRAALVTLIALLFVGLTAPAQAQRPRVYAITGATVIVGPGNSLSNTTVVIRDGLIEAVGADAAVPADAEVIDGSGMTVWPAFIDAYSHHGMAPAEGGGGGGFSIAALFSGGGGQEDPGIGHPIELVHPQHRVTAELTAGDFENQREIGFGAALTAPRNGIFRGSSALIAMRDSHPRDYVIQGNVTTHVGFDQGQFFGGYPADILGTVTTMRQVMYDVQRYAEWKARWEANPSMPRPVVSDAHDALVAAHADPIRPVFHANSLRQIETSIRVTDEFGAKPIVVGTGTEHEMLDRLAGTDVELIVPVNYPDEPDVDSDERLPSVSLDSLRRWEAAAGNAARLEAAGIRFALTAYGLGNASKFPENVRKAIEAGLSEDTALAAVTTIPAEMYGVADLLGTVEAGKIANVVVATGAPFGEETEIRHIFVDGDHHEMEAEEAVGDPDAVVDPRGEWAVAATVMGNAQNSTWTIEGSTDNYSGSSSSDQGDTDFESVTLEGNAMTVVLQGPMGALEATVVIEGDEFEGSASIDAAGQTFSISFKGERTSGPEGGAR